MADISETAPPQPGMVAQRPLSEVLLAGHALTPTDVAEIKEGLARRDAWIKHYQQQEAILNDRILGGRKFLQEMLQSLRVPITGYGIQHGKVRGLYHDLWVGPRLDVTIQPKRPVTHVVLHGWVPDDTPEGGQLTFQVGDRVATKDLVPKLFALSVELAESTDAAIVLTVEATRWITPEGPNGRMLVFVLREIELGHAI